MFKEIVVTVMILGCVASKDVQLEPAKASKLMQDALQCLSETGADPALLIQIREKKYSDDEKIKKFFLCAFKKTGIASKKGAIRVERFLDIYPDKVDKEPLKKVVVECEQEDGEPMDKVYNFFKCYAEKTPVHIAMFRN